MTETSNPAMKKWKVISESEPIDYRIFDIVTRVSEHPTTKSRRPYYVLRSRDWVNVIALTPDDEVVLIRQYRHGTAEVTLEIPGGIVDEGETHLESAIRELREETGFEAREWRRIGVVNPNPAFIDNQTPTFLALDARKVSEPEFDEGELVSTELHPLGDVERMIRSGEISHSLVVCAFFHLTMEAGGWRRPASPLA